MKVIPILSSFLIWMAAVTAQETRTVTGQVLDAATGMPIKGATVTSKKNIAAVQTQADGLFSCLTFSNDTLMITHVNYERQELAVTLVQQGRTIQLLPKGQELEEVTINTGYQKLTPNQVNGSYVVIDNKTLNLQSGTNILDRLNGVTGGLLFNVGKSNRNPENSTNISIRGLSTINGPLDPLIVMDNFIYDGDINNINPNDVESVTILKDAAAASIWGARAGNGVIVITTKRGRFAQKLEIGLSSNVIITEKPDLFSTPQIAIADYIDFEQFLFGKDFYKKQLNSWMKPVLSPAVQVFDLRKRGLLSAKDSAERIEELKQNDSRRQFTEYYYRKGITQQYALNLRGGSNNLAWLASATYDKLASNLDATSEKINLRFENTFRPFQRLDINVGVYYTNGTEKDGLPSYNTLTNLNNRYVPYVSLASVNGESVPVPKDYNRNFLDTVGRGRLQNWNYYPMEEYRHNNSIKNREELLANVGLRYKIGKELDAQLQYQYQRQNSNIDALADTASYFTRNLVNLYSQINPQTGVVRSEIPSGGILTRANGFSGSYNIRGQLNYQHASMEHAFGGLLGFEARSSQSTSGTRNVYYGYNRDPLQYVSVLDFVSYFPTILGDRARIPSFSYMTSELVSRFVSIFANSYYSYRNIYQFTGSVRRDGSNIFGANTNEKWKPLWSAGLGWVLSNESFYKVDWMPFFKLSLTYGVSGNVDVSKTPLPLATQTRNANSGLPSAQILGLNNPSLRWEKSYQGNLRIEFGLKENIVTGRLEYYRKKGTDLYGPMPYDYTAWGLGSTITANVANMIGRGVDVNITTTNLNSSVKWQTNFLFNYNKSITTKYLTEDSKSLIEAFSGGKTITPIVGKPLYALAAYRWGGLDASGNPQGYLKGVLSTDYSTMRLRSLTDAGTTYYYIGPANPEIFGGVLNSLSYKGITVAFNLLYKAKYYFLKPTLGYSSLASYGTNGVDFGDRWQQPGDEVHTNVPSLIYPFNPYRDSFFGGSDINVLQGAHVRLQFITLGYSPPPTSSLLKDLQVYLNVSNLGIVWRKNKERVDPDYPNTIPPAKTYTIGIRAKL